MSQRSNWCHFVANPWLRYVAGTGWFTNDSPVSQQVAPTWALFCTQWPWSTNCTQESSKQKLICQTESWNLSSQDTLILQGSIFCRVFNWHWQRADPATFVHSYSLILHCRTPGGSLSSRLLILKTPKEDEPLYSALMCETCLLYCWPAAGWEDAGWRCPILGAKSPWKRDKV